MVRVLPYSIVTLSTQKFFSFLFLDITTPMSIDYRQQFVDSPGQLFDNLFP